MALVQHHPALNRPPAPVLSVCIANYNGVHMLADCIGSLLAPLGLGFVMDQAGNYGFYAFFALFACLLSLMAWKQKRVPVEQRSVHVNVPAAASQVMADLDPRNDSGVVRPFDEAEAQAYVDELNRGSGEDGSTLVKTPAENEERKDSA